MLNLATALHSARQALFNSGAESALVSRNIASASQAGYNRRVAEYSSEERGLGVSVTVRRIAEDALRNAALEADSNATGAATRESSLELLDSVAGTKGGTTTLPQLLGALQNALTTYGNDPSRDTLGSAAVRAAGSVARQLNSLSDAATTLRTQADQDMATSVASINDLLARFKVANDGVTTAMATSRDPSEFMDERDAILADLSKEIGVTVRPQKDGGLALYADGGLTLFEKEPRKVSFSTSGALYSGRVGAVVTIDGVDATSSASMMKVGSGRLAALAALRDQTGVALQAQYDETARALISNFSEGGSPGLFVPAAGGQGLAGRIRINALADPDKGGDVTLLRDGGMAGTVYNASGVSGFSDRLRALASSFDANFTFSTDTQVAAASSLKTFAADAHAWLAGERQDASNATTRESAIRDRTVQNLSNATGVNVDEEMSRLLEVERAYQASAKILTAVDEMFGSLLQAIR
jgi:flagellar hook-associated protein 1 FlgK